MAGSNRSGDLKDASSSIPRGTIAATSTASIVYLSGVLFFGASINPMFLRDKFGESAFGRLAIAELAVLFPMVILIGCCMSTIGAGMQSLCGKGKFFNLSKCFLFLFLKNKSDYFSIKILKKGKNLGS